MTEEKKEQQVAEESAEKEVDKKTDNANEAKEAKEMAEMSKVMSDIEKAVSEIAIQAVITKDQIHITVSKEMNDRILNFITSRTKDKYGLTLNSLYGCQYHVSPFINSKTNEGTDINNIGVVIGLFNYAQMLGQWNTFTDNGRKYDLNDLLNNYKIIINPTVN